MIGSSSSSSQQSHNCIVNILFFLLLLPFLFHTNNNNNDNHYVVVFVESFSYPCSSNSNRFVSLQRGRKQQQQQYWKEYNHPKGFGSSSSDDDDRKSISLTSLSAVAATTTVVTAAFPTVKDIIMTCLTPTLLGFYKSEYGVSYGYGTATAATAYLAYRSLTSAAAVGPLVGLAKCHAMAVVFYGIRLNVLLLYREMCIPRFRDMRERIEERAMSKGGRWTRTPFILSCAGLYAGLAAPTLITAKLALITTTMSGRGLWGRFLWWIFRSSIYATWGGVLMGAIGDVTKSVYKARRGDDYLVTNGIFRFLRHPNYTGEIIAWTANCLAALSATAMCLKTPASWKAFAPYLLLSMASLPGIVSVLLAATMNLEQKQRSRYDDNESYAQWKQKSWVGLTFDLSAGRSESTTN